MRNARTLSLKRETLTALTSDDLAAVAGGSHLCYTTTYTTSIDVPCPTLPLYPCLSLNSCDVEVTAVCL